MDFFNRNNSRNNGNIEQFLNCRKFAVAGASTNREKYGNKVVRAYRQKGLELFPVNPKEKEVEGIPAYPSVRELPEGVDALSVVTPPSVTVEVVREALERKIHNIWMQPGAENEEAVKIAKEAGANVISDGSCVLVLLGYREET